MNSVYIEYMVVAFHSEPPVEESPMHFLQNHTVKPDIQKEAPVALWLSKTFSE